MQMWPGERSPGTDVAGVSPRSARNVDEVEEEGAAVLRRPRERVGEEHHQLVEVEDGRVLIVVLMSNSRTHRADNRTDAKETSNSRVLLGLVITLRSQLRYLLGQVLHADLLLELLSRTLGQPEGLHSQSRRPLYRGDHARVSGHPMAENKIRKSFDVDFGVSEAAFGGRGGCTTDHSWPMTNESEISSSDRHICKQTNKPPFSVAHMAMGPVRPLRHRGCMLWVSRYHNCSGNAGTLHHRLTHLDPPRSGTL